MRKFWSWVSFPFVVVLAIFIILLGEYDPQEFGTDE